MWNKKLPSRLTVCSCHVAYAFQSKSTLYSCLNVKELLAQSRRKIWSLSEYNWTRTHNHLFHKRILNHLAKLAKWISCVVSTYLYGTFDCTKWSSFRLWTNWLWVRVELQSLKLHAKTCDRVKLRKIIIHRWPFKCWKDNEDKTTHI